MRRRGGVSVRVTAISAGVLLGSMLSMSGATATAAASVSSSKTRSAGPTVGHVTRAAQTHGPYSAPSRLPLAVNQADAPNPGKPGSNKHNPPPPSSNAAIPTVSCAPALAGCDTISSSGGGATTNAHAMSATDNQLLYGEDIEPPDQGLCAGNGYAMEAINIGEIQVFDHSTLNPVSSAMSLDSLMGLTSRGWSSGGDIMCLYDPDHGGHWFITEFVSTNNEASGGAFTGCFAGTLDSCREGMAVSSGSNPLTSTWNVYFFDPNTLSPSDPGAGYLLNDFAKIGNTADALLLFYDEFNQSSTLPACPSYGCQGFNGSQEVALQKSALESGAATVNLVHENMGTDPTIQPPDGSCATGPTAGATCWYQNIPAQSPSDSDFDNNFGGTGFMVGSLDFLGTGDNRVAVFYWKGLSNLNSSGCSSCSAITFGHQLFTGVKPYMNEGADCPASEGGVCGLAAQRAGTLDLGSYCKKLVTGVKTPTCPENGIATNGDGTTQASYVGGHLYFAISTLLNEVFGGRGEIHTGGAYWIVSTAPFTGATPTLALTSQGYVAAAHEDIEFPTLAGGTAGALMSFTLSGNGGPTAADGGGYFPSSAYGRVTSTSAGLTGSTIDVTALGQGPQDGFSEYGPVGGIARPRWGDYGAAVFVPGAGFYFASEYIPYPTCAPTYFYKVDSTCGGTRDQNANFGTSLSHLP